MANGTTADATQVMANLSCAALYGLAHTTANVGIGFTTPAFALQIATQGAQQDNGMDVAATDGRQVVLEPSSAAGNWNSIVQAGDTALIAGGPTVGTGALVLAPWSNTLSGIRIASNGNVGIGTAAPSQLLSLAASEPQIAFAAAASGRTAAIGFSDGYNLFVSGPTGGNLLLDSAGGNVGVGSASTSYAFYVNGPAGGATVWTNTSDARLKRDVSEISNALTLVEQLRGVRYRWKPAEARELGKELKLPLDAPQIGFIAQEVEKVVPEAVATPKDPKTGLYGVKEAALVPLLVEAIKEQQAEIKQQQAEIEQLQARLDQSARH